ncbi:MAG: class II fructose-bisphosphate aldolase [Spirochaetaceae bacterium]|jgi:ketose-bisphosphate aldolase|nr:class II fructose-bisphosphate aldolase [Spirochaetaceae bacterium]
MTIQETVLLAQAEGRAVPAFNIPYLPMVEPVARAIGDEKMPGIIHVARVEWIKFQSESLEAVAREYRKYGKPGLTYLGLDHIPVIDEDQKTVDYLPVIRRALNAGYESVMLDGSRLDLEGNIASTKTVADLAHRSGVACEGEIGAVMGHESGPMKPYEEIFAAKLGFTKTDEAARFAEESGCDWMSVAVGNIHGAVAEATRHQKKPEARLDVAHIAALSKAGGVPLVLHGGSGIPLDYIRRGIAAGIAKINVGTEIRQVYERELTASGAVDKAQEAVYRRTREILAAMTGGGDAR